MASLSQQYKVEPVFDYFSTQTNFQPHMRVKLISWILEVCSELRF